MTSRRRFDAHLRHLTSAGFDAARQGVLLSGRAEHRNITVLVLRDAIEGSFPKIASTSQCATFVERNLIAFRDIAQAKLFADDFVELPALPGWPHADLLVEVTIPDLLRSRRWLTP